MKTLILDYSIWRCGSHGEHKLGEGSTTLLNKKGYMCCLGQFTPQLNPKIEKESLFDKCVPAQLQQHISHLTREDSGSLIGTALVASAVEINDDPDTTPKKKITALRKLFGEKGYKIRVINRPKKS